MVDYNEANEIMSIECDYCGDSEEVTGSFQECLKELKDKSWKIIHDDTLDEFYHFCKEHHDKAI